MDLRGYLTALWKSWWLIVLLALIGGGGGAYEAYSSKPVYAAKVGFYVRTPVTTGTSSLAADQYAQARANSYALLLKSDTLARQVKATTGLPLSSGGISSKISGLAQLNTVLVSATIKDTNKARALEIASAIATDFPSMVSTLDNSPTNPSVSLAVVSGPSVGNKPIAPRKTLEIALGVAVGLIAGVALAVLRQLLDTSLRSIEAVEGALATPVLGTVTFDNAAKTAPLVLDQNARSLRAEEYRQLRTSLQFVSVDEAVDVLIVTSSVEGEGKSTTSINLGLMYAKTGRRVLLVDADLRRPGLGTYLGLTSAVGLTDVLVGEASVDDVVQPFGDTSLSVLLGGQLPPNPSELLGSTAMTKLVGDLRSKYDLVIFDTPPVVPVTDASVLAASVVPSAVLVVVRWGKTRRQSLSTAVRSLNSVDARIVGAVLNMKRLSRAQRKGYVYYGRRGAHTS